jgi:hypothetical protein
LQVGEVIGGGVAVERVAKLEPVVGEVARTQNLRRRLAGGGDIAVAVAITVTTVTTVTAASRESQNKNRRAKATHELEPLQPPGPA